MNEAEALADAATGGVIARAAEPRAAGVGPDGHTTERNCLNCGTTLVGDYCHACGQRGHVHRSLHAFGHDLLHGVLHFEGKIWRTLPMLIWRPGTLTRRYIEGQRATYISPIALFLFCVFLMFAVLSATGMIGLSTPLTSDMQGDVAREITRATADVQQLEQQRRAAAAASRPTAGIDQRLAEARNELRALKVVRAPQEGEEINSLDTSIPALNEAYMKAKRNPDLLIYKLKTNAYKFSWMLIPLSVPFVWLLFPFSRRFRLYDHTVFVTYSLCFMTLLAIAGGLLMRAGLSSLAGLLWFAPPVHMYRQLRGAYNLSRLAALWRTVLLIGFTMVTSLIFLLILVALGIFD